jgi:hypothetical protein
VGAAKVFGAQRSANTSFIRNGKALTAESAVADAGGVDAGSALASLTVGATAFTPLLHGTYDVAGLYFTRAAIGSPELAKITTYLEWKFGL